MTSEQENQITVTLTFNGLELTLLTAAMMGMINRSKKSRVLTAEHALSRKLYDAMIKTPEPKQLRDNFKVLEGKHD